MRFGFILMHIVEAGEIVIGDEEKSFIFWFVITKKDKYIELFGEGMFY